MSLDVKHLPTTKLSMNGYKFNLLALDLNAD